MMSVLSFPEFVCFSPTLFSDNCCRGGRYTEEDAKTIVVQILSVVAFFHLQGVVHRDLKPEVYYNTLVFYFWTFLIICIFNI